MNKNFWLRDAVELIEDRSSSDLDFIKDLNSLLGGSDLTEDADKPFHVDDFYTDYEDFFENVDLLEDEVFIDGMGSVGGYVVLVKKEGEGVTYISTFPTPYKLLSILSLIQNAPEELESYIDEGLQKFKGSYMSSDTE